MTIPREIAVLPLVEADGANMLLSMIRADGSRVSVILGPAEAVAVAGELIEAARSRRGRQGRPPWLQTAEGGKSHQHIYSNGGEVD